MFLPPASDPPIAASGSPVNATEGASGSRTTATFTDPDAGASASEYTASIDWGDGHTSSGTVSGSGGSFSVTADHTYVDEGSYAVTTTITDVDNPSNGATVTSIATVADAALAASGVSPASPTGFSGTVATFTDANAGAPSSDFTAQIDWGDGHSSAGTISGSGGSYTVAGTHTYGATGYFTVTVQITDLGGSTATATSKMLIFASPGGGAFVIGDQNASVGTPVTFWGSDWTTQNSLSGGNAPRAFKGSEDSRTPAACGTRWTTDPGNSAPPPAAPLPAYMAVAVSSKIGWSGLSLTGDTRHVVVVETSSGYAPNVGHDGTGTVVATVC